MNPDLEFFLEKAFDPIQPTSETIGRVVLEPDYDIDPDEKDQAKLADELMSCLKGYSGAAKEFAPPKEYPTLSKYVREISFHDDRLDGPWVEVNPPGNWI